MKIVSLLLLTLFSVNALAHPGHGESSWFAHDLEHALWVMGAASIIAMVFFALRKRQ